MAESLSDVYHSVKAALDIFKRTPEPTADVPSKQTLLQAAEHIKADAAKSKPALLVSPGPSRVHTPMHNTVTAAAATCAWQAQQHCACAAYPDHLKTFRCTSCLCIALTAAAAAA